jgi:hypothetical protein
VTHNVSIEIYILILYWAHNGHCMVYVVDSLLDVQLKECTFFSILSDESTDLSITKNLIIYVRFVRDGVAQTKFLGNVMITEGTADGITGTILTVLKQRQLNVLQLVGFCSDGASVMTGRVSGVGARLAQHAHCLLSTHCMTHRLALMCVDAVKENVYLQKYRSMLGQLNAYFSCSAVRQHKLALAHEVLGAEGVRVEEYIAVRRREMHDDVVAVTKRGRVLLLY